MPSINPFQDIDPILSNDFEQSDDSHLWVIYGVTAEEFETLCGSNIQENDNNTDSEWEEAEN